MKQHPRVNRKEGVMCRQLSLASSQRIALGGATRDANVRARRVSAGPRSSLRPKGARFLIGLLARRLVTPRASFIHSRNFCSHIWFALRRLGHVIAMGLILLRLASPPPLRNTQTVKARTVLIVHVSENTNIDIPSLLLKRLFAFVVLKCVSPGVA